MHWSKYFIFSFLSFIFFVTVCSSTSSNDSSSLTNGTYMNISIPTTTTEIPVLEKWRATEKMLKTVASLVVQNSLPFMMKGMEKLNISTKCSSSLLKTLAAIKKTKYWAVRMLDASGKLPNGILSGSLATFGDYDSCVELKVPKQFQGQYCLIDVTAPLPKRRPFLPVDLRLPEFENFSNPDTLVDRMLVTAQHYYYLGMRLSFCVPSTCSAEDIQQIADLVLDEIGIGWTASVSNCEIKKSVVLDKSELAVACILGAVVLLVLVGTLADVVLMLSVGNDSYKHTSGIVLRILFCFSAYSNTLRLLKPDNSPDSVKLFHGMKVITAMWVILNHTYLYNSLHNGGDLLNAREVGKDISYQLVFNGFLSVETFFFISAVLIMYFRMKSKIVNINIFLYIFKRIWRLTPPVMFVIAVTFLVPHMGAGPIWKETVGTMANQCRNYWWTNLIYINNFMPSADSCLQWTWYVAADMHLYILALLPVIPIKRRPRLGLTIIALMLVISIVIVAVNNVYYQLYPTGLYVFPHPEDKAYFADYGYFRTHLHISTYCVGMIAGYILATRDKLRIPIVINVLGWIVAFVMALVVLYGVYDWNQGNLPSPLVSTLYACTNKIVWSLSLSWVTITCFTGNGGVINNILSWSAFVPLGRLTFMAYLIHPILQHMYIGSTRVLIVAHRRTYTMMFLGHVVGSFALAYFFSLMFEAPFMALEKILFANSIKKMSENEDKTEERRNSSLSPSKNGIKSDIYAINIKRIETDT